MALKRLIALLAVMTPFGQSAGQTFKGTVSWMHHASEYNYTVGKDGESGFTEVPITNTCHNFVIVQKHSGKHSIVSVLTLDLEMIEPKQVYFEPVKGKPWSYVSIGTTNDEPHIHSVTTVDGQQRSDTNTAGAMLYFGGNSFAQRFAKALRHAVVLCGGKPSFF
jgi:hypothetical protein